MEHTSLEAVLLNNGNRPPPAPGQKVVKQPFVRSFTSCVSKWYAEKYGYLLINSILFLLGAILSIKGAELVPYQPSQYSNFYPKGLDPTCTDFGDSPEERYLALDLVSGEFSFTKAKIIDVAWDTAVGQGGRLFHGWILYRCVIYPLLILAMEISAVSYSYYTTLSFSHASFETLWAVSKALYQTRSFSVLLCSILLVYLLGYALFFPLIWGAATGYISLSQNIFPMPGEETTPLDSNDLTLCWVLDHRRLGLSVPYVEIGPGFSDIIQQAQTNRTVLNLRHQDYCTSNYGFRYGIGGWYDGFEYRPSGDVWTFLEPLMDNTSIDFINVQRYALTKQALQVGLNPSGWSGKQSRTPLVPAWLNTTIDSGISELNWWREDNPSRVYTYHNSSKLYSTVRSVELAGVDEPILQSPARELVDRLPYNTSGPNRANSYWSTFSLNQSIQLGPGIVPYNSTLWLNKTSFTLSAPFLDVGVNCSSTSDYTGLGNCVCYKEQPISPDYLDSSKAICNTASGFRWGFSSNLLRLGLYLEGIWMACCFAVHPWLVLRSRLLRSERMRTAKVYRLLLDCSESIHSDLGPNAKTLNEDELKRELKNFNIGFEANLDGEKQDYHIASGLVRRDFKERLLHIYLESTEKLRLVKERIGGNVRPISTVINRQFRASDIVPDPVHDRRSGWVDMMVALMGSYLPFWRRRSARSREYEDLDSNFE
ncbi:hypothetical protein GGR57DRAFT_360093 [Xylariaceae sp. FL1272]|nr:hypothetical protein GGR57DRAFT_360093 [Xylariaceae sp. FL1272]